MVVECAHCLSPGVSMGTSESAAPIRFGAFELDATNGELRKAGITLKIHPQPLQVLLLLTQHAGEVVTREQIREQLWGQNTFVDFEHGINFCIAQVRGTLGDNSEKPRYVETLARRGYRFIAPVTKGATPAALTADERIAERQPGELFPEVANPAGAAGTVRPPLAGVSTRKWKYSLAALSLVVITAAALGWQWRSRQGEPTIRSIAVLPLQNLSNDSEQEYFSDGMTDALITYLAQINSLKVISRTSSMQYKQTKKSLPEIARELSVDGIIEGTVQRSGDRVRITAQLIHGPSDKHIWANSYEGDLRDVFTLERDVTEDIARQIQTRLVTKKRVEQTQPRPMDPKALEAFLQGNYHLNKQSRGSGDEEKKQAAEYFQQAIAADPNFTPAYRGLGLAHGNRLLGSREDFAIARKAWEKVVEIDPHYSPGRVNLAVSKWTPDLDWRGAEEDLRQAVALDPNSAAGHSALCNLLVVMGHVDEGLRECRIAQRVDPFDEDSALGLYLGRDYDGSIAMLRIMLQKDPTDGFAHCFIFPDYMMKAMNKESIQELGQCFSLLGQPEMAGNIQRAFEASGYHAAIRQWAKDMEHLQETHQAFLPANLAIAYTILGDKDRAFYWLEQAYDHRDLTSFDEGVYYMGAEPMYDPLRSDPRFQDLLRRVGL
jgi:TolB-like protein/DNA-binding winged helix-turn-helix (wHTH) protein/tetratricopeptide (TPR) repeat protein